MLNRTVFALALVSVLSSHAYSAEGKYDFSHYACGPLVQHIFDDRGILKITGGDLRPANDTQENIFLPDNFFRRELVNSKMAFENVVVKSDGTIIITGLVDVSEGNLRGGGFVGRTMVEYIPHGELFGTRHSYEATKKSTGEVITYALGAAGDAGLAGWSVYHADNFISPMLPKFTVDFQMTDSSVAFNLNKFSEKAVNILCGDNATAYAFFTK